MYTIAPPSSKKIFTLALFLLSMNILLNAQNEKAKPEDTEFYTPVPKIVTPGKTDAEAPSDALVLFDGKNLDQWHAEGDSTRAAGWKVQNGIVTVDKKSGGIITRQTFSDYQLHIEYRIPKNITGSGQARGNSGIYLAAIDNDGGDVGYELQVLDNYNNTTYVNGQAGSIYKQSVPLANPCRKPGEWQAYEVVWTAPRFKDDGTLDSPARVTVFLNGVLVQNNFALKGVTQYIGQPYYKMHGPAPIKLQAHGDKSEPISYRNIWIRRL
ncbi:MAG: DUF1080 domain-containing protein [Bacteroidota bacterium]|nr:DUF1080 domain-containing protein [Bacteroidota bacterium]MDP4212825.1 DUF1080 domain-containing protein [Bacteroidota bacterium]MDP4249007.1 DUF1080 domain-containing protein [Bacteroidota bacterium]